MGRQDKEEVIKYVTEEVDRVKGLFDDKERRLTAERDAARDAQRAAEAAAQQAASRAEEATAAAAAAAKEAAATTTASLEPQLAALRADLAVCTLLSFVPPHFVVGLSRLCV